MQTTNRLSPLEIEVGLEKGTLTEGQIGELIDFGYVTRREGQAVKYSPAVMDPSFNYGSRTMRQIEPDVFVTPAFVDYVVSRAPSTVRALNIEMPYSPKPMAVGYRA